MRLPLAIRLRLGIPFRAAPAVVQGGGSGSSGSGTPAPVVAGGDAFGYRPAPLSEAPPGRMQDAASERWVRRIVDVVNRSLAGKLNVTLNVTLSAGTTSTVIVDARISAFSMLAFSPLTANAAAEQAAGGLYVSEQRDGQATVEHTNSAQTDRTYRLAIFG